MANGPNFSPTIPQFFAMIPKQCNKLQIPKTIVKKWGLKLTNEVLLKLPCNKEWKVGLTKTSDGKVWIQKGWLEFSRYYSLATGRWLFFKCKSDSQFQVFIFDKSSIEIDYRRICKEVKEEAEDYEIWETFPSHSTKTRSKPVFPCSQPSKRRKTISEGTLNLPKRSSGVERNIPHRRLRVKDKAEVLKKASGFSSNHPYFMLPVQPSFIQKPYNLNVPIKFAKSHLGDVMKEVILKAPNGRTWSVRYNFHVAHSKPKFEAGWKEFALDNDLKCGDVCVFAMTERTSSISFEVSIFRENGIINSASVPEQSGSGLELRPKICHLSKVETGNTTTDKKAEISTTSSFLNCQSERPSFTVRIPVSYVAGKNSFKIPAKFAKTYMTKKKGKARLLVSDGRFWSVLYKVKLMMDGYSRAEISKGWGEFARETGLEEGDICTFKLTNRDDSDDDEIVFEVSIVKPSHEANDNHPGAKLKVHPT